jgi:hypothetical protein
MRRFENEAEREALYKAVYDSDHWEEKIAPRVPKPPRPLGDGRDPHRLDREIDDALAGAGFGLDGACGARAAPPPVPLASRT